MNRYIALLLAFLLAGCADEQATPEQQVREVIKAAELAVENRSVSEVMPFVSNQYTDQSGRNRKSLVRVLTGYFLRHQNVHLLVQVKRLETIADQEVRAELLVAMAGKPLDGIDQLLDYRADLHHFELIFEEQDGEWVVTSGDWRRASQADFFLPIQRITQGAHFFGTTTA